MLKDRTILVTGAASGIGQALARKLSYHPINLILLDVAQDALESTGEEVRKGQAQVFTYCCDITDEGSLAQIANEISTSPGPIDTLINNAGISMRHGPFMELCVQSQKKVMDVNFWGAVNCIRTFYPQLDHHEDPHILNVGSIFGEFPVPDKMTYSISKNALHTLTEGLKQELPAKFSTSLIIPGGVDTNITRNSIGWVDPKRKTKAQLTSKKTASHSAGDVADYILNSIGRRTNETVTVGASARIMKWGSRMFPALFQQLYVLGNAYYSKQKT